MTSLTNKALLVTLNISMWTARKLDKREGSEIARKHGAADGVARVNKSLLPGAESLDKVSKLAGTIRTDYYQLTLPWVDGMGIIKADGYLGFTQIMSRHKANWDVAVARFLSEYPSLRDAAKARLNGLYSLEDYPHPRRVEEKFKLDIAFYPVPDAGDWRVSLSDEETERLKAQITEKVMESQGRAMKEAWDRIHGVVRRAHERLSQPDAIFRDSLIENARELCRILPSLNITDDPHMERMRDEVERHLCDYEPDDLRRNPGVRAAVSDKLAEIMSKMGPFMGAA